MSQSVKKARQRDAAAGITSVLSGRQKYDHPNKKAFPTIVPKSVFLMSAGTTGEAVFVNNLKGSKARRMLDQLKSLIASGAKKCRINRLSKRIARELKKFGRTE